MKYRHLETMHRAKQSRAANDNHKQRSLSVKSFRNDSTAPVKAFSEKQVPAGRLIWLIAGLGIIAFFAVRLAI
jgi:hypothetical protein